MNRPLRILVAHNAPAKRTGGMSRIMGLIHDELVLAGHSVDYFCAENSPEYFRGSRGRFAFPILVLRQAMRAARARRPYDVVNVHEPSGAAITLFKRLAGSPRVVVTSHGVEQRAWERTLEQAKLGREGPSLRSRLFYPATTLWQARIALRRADHIFCLNTEDRAYLGSRFQVPSSRVTRIYPAADPVYGRAAAGRDYSRARTVLFAGTWMKRKGIDDLIQVFRQLASRHADLKLLVLNGGVPESVVRQSFPATVHSRILYRNAEPEEGNANAMASADVYVLPSVFEGTPLTLIEAMWSGLPIVTTSTCGMKDVIADGNNGLLVPIRSPEALLTALDRLLTDQALRERLGRSAHVDAQENYTWQRVARPIRDCYEQLCNVKQCQSDLVVATR